MRFRQPPDCVHLSAFLSWKASDVGTGPATSKRQGEHFEASTPAQQHVLRTCRAFASRLADSASHGDSLLLIGGPGTGKTHLASAILAKAIRAGRTGCFFSVAAALRLVRDTYSPNAMRSEIDSLALLTEPDLLVLDEVGVAIGHDDKRQAILFDILGTRYAGMKSTVLIANLTITEIRAYLGERLMDRLSDAGSAVLSFDWSSYRQRRKEAADPGAPNLSLPTFLTGANAGR
ncbi:ATP-binding protein [Thiorhodovibrio winogradskyi]|nr:ATP-binding protein [Thiorhodovibrio winogradskyi]